MKKLTSIVCALSLLISVSAFTPIKDDNVSAKIRTEFKKTFESASNVNWKKMNDFYLASFTVNNQNFTAAYTESGVLMSASRDITLSQLPLNIRLALQDKYAGYNIGNNLTEIMIDSETSYYIKAENKKCTLNLKANSNGDLSVESKTKSK